MHVGYSVFWNLLGPPVTSCRLLEPSRNSAALVAPRGPLWLSGSFLGLPRLDSGLEVLLGLCWGFLGLPGLSGATRGLLEPRGLYSCFVVPPGWLLAF